MAKTRTKAPAMSAPVPQNREQAVAQLAEIGVIQRELTRRKADQNDQLARILEQIDAASEPLRQQLVGLEAGLQTWCEANRAALTNNGKVKHADLGTGVVKWEACRKNVRGVPNKAENLAKFIAKLKDLGLSRFIRTKEEVDKEAMQAEPDVAETIAGIKVQGEGEEFVIEPFEAKLEGAAA